MKKSNLLFTFVLVLLMVVTIGSISAGAMSGDTGCVCEDYGIHIEVTVDGDVVDFDDGSDYLYDSIYIKTSDTTKLYAEVCSACKDMAFIELNVGTLADEAAITGLKDSYEVFVYDQLQDKEISLGEVKPYGYVEVFDTEAVEAEATVTPTPTTDEYVGSGDDEDILTINYYTVKFYNRKTGKQISAQTQYVLEGQKIVTSYLDKSKYTTTFYNHNKDTVYKSSSSVYEQLSLDVEWTITGQVLAPAASETTAWYDLWWNTDYSTGSTINYTSIFDAFTDIDNHWASNQIEFCVKRGLFIGTSETTFGPSSYMTNGMLMTVLYRNSGSPAVSVTSDVYYAAPMAWGASFITSYGDELIDPNANGTREQLIYMIYNYAISCGIDVSATADLSAYADAGDVTYEKAMQWAVTVGIIEGKPDSLLDATGNVTRAEVAAIMQRFIAWAGF